MSKPAFFGIISEVISFGETPAMIGHETNGAAPQRVYGFYVDGQVCEHDGEASPGFWLRAVTAPLPPGINDDEAARMRLPNQIVMSTADIGQIDTVLGAIATAAVTERYANRLDGEFEGFRNYAQMEHDEDAHGECEYGLMATVAAADRGFDFRLSDRTSNVATMKGWLSAAEVTRVMGVATTLREFVDSSVRTIARKVEAEARQSAPQFA